MMENFVATEGMYDLVYKLQKHIIVETALHNTSKVKY